MTSPIRANNTLVAMNPMFSAFHRALRVVRAPSGSKSRRHRTARTKPLLTESAPEVASSSGSAEASCLAMAPRSSPRKTHQSRKAETDRPTTAFQSSLKRDPKSRGDHMRSTKLSVGVRPRALYSSRRASVG